MTLAQKTVPFETGNSGMMLPPLTWRSCRADPDTLMPISRALLNVLPTTTPAAFIRDMKAIGAAALGRCS